MNRGVYSNAVTNITSAVYSQKHPKYLIIRLLLWPVFLASLAAFIVITDLPTKAARGAKYNTFVCLISATIMS